jgi:hypothetical protein
VSTRNFGRLWRDLELPGASRETREVPPNDHSRSAARPATQSDDFSSGRRRFIPHAFLSRRLLPHWPALFAAVVAGLIAALWFAASLGVDDRDPPSVATSRSVKASASVTTRVPPVAPSTPASHARNVATVSPPEATADATTAPLATTARQATAPPIAARRGKNGRVEARPRFAGQSDVELLRELQQTTQVVGLEIEGQSVPAGGVRKQKHQSATAEAGKGFARLRAANPELAELPFLGDDECRTDPRSLPTVVELSRAVRSLQSSGGGGQDSRSRDVAGELRGVLHAPMWKRPEAVRTMTQMLQVEVDFVRLELVGYLSKIEGPEADRALVDRALFDLSAIVRDDAVAALKNRPLAGYRERLLAAFRHPWPAVARHAADAAVELAATDLIADLEKLAGRPDPGLAVRNADGRWIRTEMVRINHLSNCVLCHPPAERRVSRGDAVAATPIGLVAAAPTPGEPLPFRYYGNPTDGVQGDIVYLRQDFSAVHRTAAYEPWPVEQRYDYLLRSRPAAPEEIARAEAAAATRPDSSSYPQREAVLFALEHLRRQATQTAAR